MFRMFAILALAAAAPIHASAQQQIVDPDYKPAVANPAYVRDGPVVAIDEAHANFHTAAGNYRPFADLLRADGYQVRASTSKLTAKTFAGVDVFVIVNAREPFTDAESNALRDWVNNGGSLLLTADHAPFGAATQSLATKFSISMGKGWAYDSEQPGRITTQLAYSRANGLLGDHPILDGRNPSEAINVVRTFTGQSLGMPKDAVALLNFRNTAREAPTTEVLNAAGATAAEGRSGPLDDTMSLAGRVQGMALPFGKGRLVALGEAGMFSAQSVIFPAGSPQQNFKFGMNLPGTDNQQFALNVMHWLSGALK